MEINEELIEKAKELAGEKLGIDSGMLNSVTSMLGLSNSSKEEGESEGAEKDEQEDSGDGESDGAQDDADSDDEEN